jgi:hypothetical protein
MRSDIKINLTGTFTKSGRKFCLNDLYHVETLNSSIVIFQKNDIGFNMYKTKLKKNRYYTTNRTFYCCDAVFKLNKDTEIYINDIKSNLYFFYGLKIYRKKATISVVFTGLYFLCKKINIAVC